jgi:hypothetical protein
MASTDFVSDKNENKAPASGTAIKSLGNLNLQSDP